MTEDPMWLKIALGCVPLLVALVTGLFAWSNRVDKRIERLSKLVALREKVSEPINPGSALDKIILCEMWNLERVTDWDYKLLRRRVIEAGVILCFPYMYLVAETSGLVEPSSALTRWVTVGVLFIIGTVVWARWSGTMNAKHKRMKHKYRNAIRAVTNSQDGPKS